MIETSHLLLRNYLPEDWQTAHVYAADPEFSKYVRWGPNSEEETKKFIRDAITWSLQKPRYEYELAVCLKETGLQIGGCGVRRDTENSSIASLGWAMNPTHQCKGYATEAAHAAIKFGFEQMNLAIIYATCDTRNVASYRVMEKLEMKQVGLIKGTKEIKGHFPDRYRYEILRRHYVTKDKS